jgi:hypothetical protein
LVTIVLFDRQIAYLDFVAALIHLRCGASVSRDHCLCALVELVRGLDIDLSGCNSSAELASSIERELRRFPSLRNPPVQLS